MLSQSYFTALIQATEDRVIKWTHHFQTWHFDMYGWEDLAIVVDDFAAYLMSKNKILKLTKQQEKDLDRLLLIIGKIEKEDERSNNDD